MVLSVQLLVFGTVLVYLSPLRAYLDGDIFRTFLTIQYGRETAYKYAEILLMS